MVTDNKARERPPTGVVPILWPEDQHRRKTAVEWIIRDLLRKGAVGTVFGLPGSFKTWLVLDAALRIATGAEEFLGFPIEHHGPVILISADDGADTTIDRLRMISRARTGSEEYENIVLVDRGHISLMSDDAKRRLEQLVADTTAKYRTAPALIVIDTAAMAGAPTEDFGHRYPEQLGWLKEVAAEAGCAIVLVDHVAKPSPERGQVDVRSRGWGSVMKSGFFEFAWSLSGRHGADAIVDLEVSDKRSPRQPKLTLTFTLTDDSYAVSWEPARARVNVAERVVAAVIENGGPMTIDEMAEATGLGRHLVSPAAKKALKVVKEGAGTRPAFYDVG